jgi:hypothetical protein
MSYYPATPFVPQFLTDTGVPLSGGTITAYLADTTTPTNMFIDDAGTSAGSVITLNARGEPQVSGNTVVIWLGSAISYKFVLKDASSVTKWTINDIANAGGELRTDLANTTDTALGDALIGVKKTGGNATTQHIVNESRMFDLKADFGASGDGVADDTLNLQSALDSNSLVVVPPGKYRITSPLIIDPARNRGVGLISASLATRYPYTQQSGGPIWDGTQESVIYYDGDYWPVIASTAATSVSMIVGNRGMTVSSGLGFVVGQPITAYVTASPSDNRMYGTVVSYDSGTGAIVINVTSVTGSGTYAGWTVIAYDNHAVISASSADAGVEPTASFDTTIWGLAIQGITLDANGKAGFCLYTARVQDLQLRHTRARGATVAGFSVNGTYSGSIESCRAYLNPGRGFELGAADDRWGWTAQDNINALYVRDLHCDANGSAGIFREADDTLRQESCGVFFGPHRGASINGLVSENNFGANIVFAPSDKGNSICGLYTELGCSYAPDGAGTDAITLGYATEQWGLIFIGSSGATHNRIQDGVLPSDHIWLSGSEPTAAREEGAFELYNISLAGGVTADWANYRLINCALELETITGSSPAGAFTVVGGLQFGAGDSIFNYYEEGVWTPTLIGVTGSGTGWAYSVNAAAYTRIGRHVFVSGRITLSAVSGDATGQIAINGLPFTAKTGDNYFSASSISSLVALNTAVVSITGTIPAATTQIRLSKKTAAATADSSLLNTDLTSTSSITFSGHYVSG